MRRRRIFQRRGADPIQRGGAGGGGGGDLSLLFLAVSYERRDAREERGTRNAGYRLAFPEKCRDRFS